MGGRVLNINPSGCHWVTAETNILEKNSACGGPKLFGGGDGDISPPPRTGVDFPKGPTRGSREAPKGGAHPKNPVGIFFLNFPLRDRREGLVRRLKGAPNRMYPNPKNRRCEGEKHHQREYPAKKYAHEHTKNRH